MGKEGSGLREETREILVFPLKLDSLIMKQSLKNSMKKCLMFVDVA